MRSAKPGTRYWAFLSYSRRDERRARALHRQLEAYRIPPEARSPELPGSRLRPVFRDDDELAASGDLGGRLRTALDHSRHLVVLASPAAAASRWVDAEIRHFVDAGRAGDVLVLVVGGEPPALPPALTGGESEPLWLDARGRTTSRKTFLRLVAGMLGIGFDQLWRRDRRRRRRLVAAWTAGTLVLGALFAGGLWRQQRIAAEDQPQRQVAAFRQYLEAETLDGVEDLDRDDLQLEIVRTDDLNADSRVDFFVFNRTSGFCGSGGCGMDVYLTEGRGRYRVVLNLFGSSTPRTRDAKSGRHKEIVASHYLIDSEPLYTVYRWSGAEYGLSHYDYCDGVFIEYCEPIRISPVEPAVADRLTVGEGAPFLRKPADDAPTIEHDATAQRVLGTAPGGEWYLVEAWKGYSGFVHRRYVTG